jgi:NADH-quinone oxidoreductase subunit J
METIMFYVLAAVTLASAFCVVSVRRPIHNVLFMILTMIGLAGLFILLQAEFVAMVQLVVYAGAIMVLFLFVIMLLNLDQVTLPLGSSSARSWYGMGLAVYLFLLLAPIMLRFVIAPHGAPQAQGQSNTSAIAEALFTTYLLPFEIASVLLLAAIIGTVLLAGKRPRG